MLVGESFEEETLFEDFQAQTETSEEDSIRGGGVRELGETELDGGGEGAGGVFD